MKIFISYRRDDSAGYAGRLFDYLSAHFGAENVFMDIDTIEPGEDFRKVVSRAMGTCDVVLVMIGKQWLHITDGQGRRRLDDARDLVRMEVGAALSNRRIRVIPVLVRDAAMPGEHELPEGLKELAWRNAIELSDSRFQHDVKKLIGVIERIVVKTPTERPAPAPVPKANTNSIRNLLLLGGIPALLLLGLLIWLFRSSLSGAIPITGATPVATTALLPTETVPPLPSATATLNVPPPPSATTTLNVTVAPSETPTPVPSLTATQLEVTSHLVQLVDDYYMCVNDARHDIRADYELCWDMLSDLPGEFQDYLNQNSGGMEAFIDSWNKYKVSYALYYCFDSGRHLVYADYYYHPWNDVSQFVGDRTILEYRFAADRDQWRITGAFIRNAISPSCESQPRVDKRSIFQ